MSLPPIMSGIERNMKYLSSRQQVIAQNIANSETPGYKAREVSAPSFSDLLSQQGAGGAPTVSAPQVQLTAGMRSLGAVDMGPGSGVVYDKDVSETKPDGNNVTLEDQLLKMGDIQADFTAMTNIYRKQMGLLKTALGVRGGG